LACVLDTAALSLDLNEQSQVCAQSLFVRSKPSPSAIWLRKWKRDSWTRHLSGRILKPSLGQRFATEWTSSLVATHASPSVQPANAKVSKTRGIFGRLLQMAFDFSNPSAAILKTSKDISAWGCPTSSKTWQEWVIERRGAYSARLNAARHTSASGSSSWPTARTNDSAAGRPNDGKDRIGKNGERFGINLSDKVIAEQNWPSPVASEVRQGFQDRSRGMKGGQESLTTVVIKGWPTPNAADSLQGGTTQGNRKDPNLSIAVHGPPVPASSSTDGSRQESWPTPNSQPAQRKLINGKNQSTKTGQIYGTSIAQAVQQWQTATVSTGAHKQKDGSMTDKLDQQVKSWATPRAGKTTDENPETWALRQAKGDVATMPLTAQVKNHTSGKLNSRWVETLMGLPVGWTMPSCASPVTIEQMSSDYSVTESSQQQPNERSGV
jgi:hypothetical protein